jgi:hypothetical protein
MASRASQAVGQLRDAGDQHAAEKGVVFFDGVENALEVPLLEHVFATAHNFRRHGRLRSKFDKHPGHRGHEVDREAQDHQADKARATDHPDEEVLHLLWLGSFFSRPSGAAHGVEE